jgi:hypothetical protein
MMDASHLAGRIHTMNITTKPFDYAAFIEELRVLRDSYADPPSNHRTYDSLEFKQWRHRLSDLIDRIEAKGYEINCGIGHRQFRVMSYASISSREQQAVFSKAHAETMIELNTIISNFEKYGDPNLTPAVPALTPSHPPESTTVKPLEWNKEATLSWYVKNTPVATLWGFVAVVFFMLVGAYGVGVAVEKRWPEAKSRAVSDLASTALPQQPTRAASKPVSNSSVVQPPIGGQSASHPKP